MGVGRSIVRSVKLAGYFVRFGTELLVTRPQTRQARAQWLHRFCSTALRGLGLKLTIDGEFPAKGALIANHLSYIDIIVFAAMSPCVFLRQGGDGALAGAGVDDDDGGDGFYRAAVAAGRR